jgi:hypothetical protein
MNKGIRGSWQVAVTLTAVTLAAAGFVAACGAVGGPTGLLQGKVTLGPISPVEQVGGPPNTRPYSATIAVQTTGGATVDTVVSGQDGVFAVRLPAGSYRLVPRTPEGRPLPRAAPLDATVVADATTTITIAYDTGIR